MSIEEYSETQLGVGSQSGADALTIFQKSAQAAEEARRTNPTMSDLEHPSSASQDEDSEDMDF